MLTIWLCGIQSAGSVFSEERPRSEPRGPGWRVSIREARSDLASTEKILARGPKWSTEDRMRLDQLFRRAHRAANRALFFAPAEDETLEVYRQARDQLAAFLVGEGERMERAGQGVLGLPLLVEAAELTTPSSELASALGHRGFEPYGRLWLHRDEIRKREKQEKYRAEIRRQELSLPSEFRLLRVRGNRIWSDRRAGSADALPRQLMNLLERVKVVYRDTFVLEAGPRELSETDIILFESRKAYEDYTKAPTTAGLFLPARIVSCFPRSKKRLQLRRVFVHELVHQLDTRILEMRYPPRWLQEGTAVFFESLADGEELRPPPGADDYRSRKESWWGLEKLSSARASEVLSGGDGWQKSFYNQSALLVFGLLGGGPENRAFLFEFMESTRQLKAPIADPGDLFSRILERRGETTESVESRLARVFRSPEP